MKTALAIRHVAFEDLGAFEPAFRRAGFALRYWDVGLRELAGLDPLAPDLLVLLGGPVGAWQEDAYPFLAEEVGLAGRRLDAGRPVMGICLGAQLIARAAGARIRRAAATEIGFAPISLTAAGAASCLAPFAAEPLALHWHGDSFDLPEGAVRLAATDACPNQAFAIGDAAIGFQFHPEAGATGFERWLVGHACELAGAGIDVARLRREAAAHGPALARKAERVASAWLAGLKP